VSRRLAAGLARHGDDHIVNALSRAAVCVLPEAILKEAFYRANQAGQMACHLLSCYSFGQEDFGWAAGVADSLRIRSCAKLPSRTAARVGPTHFGRCDRRALAGFGPMAIRRGNKTPLELFLAGIAAWQLHVVRLLMQG